MVLKSNNFAASSLLKPSTKNEMIGLLIGLVKGS